MLFSIPTVSSSTLTRLIEVVLCTFLTNGLIASAASTPFYQMELAIAANEHRLENRLTIELDSQYYTTGEVQLMIAQSADIDTIYADVPIKVARQEIDNGLALLVLTLPESYPEKIELSLHYSLVIPTDHPINRITAAWIELNIDSFWLPLVVGFPKFTYQARLDLHPGDYQLLSGDYATAAPEPYYLLQSRFPRLDVSFCAAPSFLTAQGKYVDVYALHQDVSLDSLLHLADRAMQFLESYIDEPADFTDKRKVIVSPREEVGYARKNYIVLSNITGRTPESLSAFLAHEFAHYWFSDALLSSPHHWLTESFAEYLSNIYLRTVYGEESFEREMGDKRERIQADTTTLAEYTGRPSYLALYHKGPLVLREFEDYLGPNAFQELINAFIDRGVRTNEELFRLIEEKFGAEAVAELRILRARI